MPQLFVIKERGAHIMVSLSMEIIPKDVLENEGSCVISLTDPSC